MRFRNIHVTEFDMVCGFCDIATNSAILYDAIWDLSENLTILFK